MADLPSVVTTLVAAMFAALVLFGWSLYALLHGSRARLRRRIAQVAGAAPRGRAGVVRAGGKRRAIQARLRQADDSRARRFGWVLRERLMQAGVRIEVAPYLLANLAAALAIGGGAALAGLPVVMAVAAAVAGGFGLPMLAVNLLARRRIGRFTVLFADALDIVVRGIRSGLPLGECIHIIGREMPDPVGAEFRIAAEGQKLGLSLLEALDRAVERMPTPEFRYFVIVLAIQQQTGGNLAETLSKLSEVLRARKRMRDKIRAFSSEAKASAVIIGSLPVAVLVMLSVIAPDYVGLLFHTATGHLVLGGGAAVMAAGSLVMRRMIDFDI